MGDEVYQGLDRPENEMTITVEVKPELSVHLQKLAQANGVSVETYLARVIEDVVPRITKRSAVELLDSWEEEDATRDPAKLEQRRADWEAFKRAVNEARSSDRLLYT